MKHAKHENEYDQITEYVVENVQTSKRETCINTFDTSCGRVIILHVPICVYIINLV